MTAAGRASADAPSAIAALPLPMVNPAVEFRPWGMPTDCWPQSCGQCCLPKVGARVPLAACD